MIYSTGKTDGVINAVLMGKIQQKSEQEKTENKDTPKVSDIKDYKETSLCGYIFYQGERMTQNEFLKRAVESSAITVSEDMTTNQAYRLAWKTLVEDKAKPLYSWGTSLYSEDGKYKFRVEDGQITGAVLAQDSNGVTFQEMANQLATGAYPYEVKGDVFWLIDNDRELFDAAFDIGQSKRHYDEITQKYNSGQISLKDYQYEAQPLILMLLGVNDDSKQGFQKLNDYFSKDIDEFVQYALENYSPQRYEYLHQHKPRI